MAEHLPVTLRQLRFFNEFIYRVSIDRVEELVPGITEFKCGIEMPAFSPLTSAGYIWLDDNGKMVANIVTEKKARPYPREPGDPERFKNHDFPITVRLFPNWAERWNHDPIIEESFPPGHLHLPPGFPGGAVQRVREWIKEEVNKLDTTDSEEVIMPPR